MGEDVNEIAVEHFFSDREYAKAYRIPAGQSLIQHRHMYSHLSVLASGTVLLHVDGEMREVTGPACLTIGAGQHHGVKALTDTVWFCIHAADADTHDDANLIAAPDMTKAQQAADAFGMGVLA